MSVDKKGTPVMGSDDKLWRLMGQVETGVAAVSEKVDNLAAEVRAVGSKVDELNGDVEGTVKVVGCKEVHAKLDRSIRKLFTNVNKPADSTQETLLPKSWLFRVKDSISAMSAIVLGTVVLAGAFIYMAHLVVNIHDSLKVSEVANAKEIKKIKKRVNAVPKYVYTKIHVPLIPDAGLKKPKRSLRKHRPRRKQ